MTDIREILEWWVTHTLIRMEDNDKIIHTYLEIEKIGYCMHALKEAMEEIKHQADCKHYDDCEHSKSADKWLKKWCKND